MTKQFSLQTYKQEIIKFIREKEAEMSRGNISKLEALEKSTDEILLKKWAWLSAIVGVIFSFIFLPFLISIMHMFLPAVLLQVLWFCTRACMGMSLLMFGAATYFTIIKSSD